MLSLTPVLDALKHCCGGVSINDCSNWEKAARNFAKAILDLLSDQANAPLEAGLNNTNDQQLSMWNKFINNEFVP